MRSKNALRYRRSAWLIGVVLCLAPAISLAEPPPHPGGVLAAMESELRALVASVSPSIVTIRSACRNSSAHGRSASSNSMSIGSGIVLDSLGHILTSARVIEDGDDYWVETYDERLFPAALVGTAGDVAVLEINATNLRPAQLLENSDLQVGSFVAAVGNSYGYAGGLTWGEVNGFRPDGTIQLSLGVPAGSSGGALVDVRGHVVGLIKAKISEPFYLDEPATGGSAKGQGGSTRRLDLPTSSVSLATPISTALRIVDRLVEGGTSSSGYIGVYVEDLTAWQAAHYRVDAGALVTSTVPGAPAERYGMQPGDLIVSVDSEHIGSVLRFKQVIAQSRPGDRLTFRLVRGGQPLALTLVTGKADWPVLDDAAATVPSVAQFPEMRAVGKPEVLGVDRRASRSQPNAALGPSATSTQSSRLESRILTLERALDSLQQEVQDLRKSGRP